MRSVNFTVPLNWAGLKSNHLRFVARLFLADWAKQEYLFLTHAFIYFSGLKFIKKEQVKSGGKIMYWVKKKGEKPFGLRANQLHSAASNLKWLLDTVTEVKPLEWIFCRKPCHFRLYNTPFNQFLTAENFYTAFQVTKKTEFLNCLCATLYNLPGKTFDEDLVKKRARWFRFASMEKKYTVFLWYSGFRWYVGKECPNIFSKGSEGGPVKIKEQIMNMIRGLTDGDVTKNEDVRQVETWDALYELDAKVKHANELKQKLKKK